MLLDDSTRARSTPAVPSRKGALRPVAVTIEYCAPGNHEKVARSLAGAIRREFPGAGVDLVASAGGVFEVRVNERLIYSKRATCRFPSDDEIFYHVAAAASGTSRDSASA